MTLIRTIELFAGAGLLGQGFHQHEMRSVLALDTNVNAVATYNANSVVPVAKVADISTAKEYIKADIILAGPPCQGFSSLGKRNKHDPRNDLSLQIFDWVINSKAKVAVIENVPNFLASPQFAKLRGKMEKVGYMYVSWVLDAADFGVAQHRRRSFTVFSKIGVPSKPLSHNKKLTVADVFASLSEKGDRTFMHQTYCPTPLALSRISKIPKGGGKADLLAIAPELCPDSWLGPMRRQATDVWGRMVYETPSNTIKCCFLNPSKGRYIHPVQNRMITLREGARLQGIADDYCFVGSRTSIASQIGNGVPVPLASAVAKSVRELFH